MATVPINVVTRKEGDGIQTVVADLAKLAASYLAVSKIVDFFGDSLKAQSDQVGAINSLNLALANQGRLTDEVSQSLQDYATHMQETTTFADEMVVKSAAMLASFGQNEEQIKRTTSAAADLASAMGTDLESATQMLGKAYAGNVTALQKMGFQFDKSATDAQKFEAALAQVEQRFGGAAQAATGTFSGALAQATNAFGEIQEAVGKFLGELINFESAGEGLKGFFLSVAKFIGQDLVIALSEARARFAEFVATVFEGAAKMASVTDKLFGTNEATNFKLAAEDQRALASELRASGDAAAASTGKLLQFKNGVASLSPAQNEAAAAAAKHAAEIQKLADALDGTKAKADAAKLAEALSLPGVEEAVLGNADKLKQVGAQIDQLVKDGLDTIPPALQRIQDAAHAMNLDEILKKASFEAGKLGKELNEKLWGSIDKRVVGSGGVLGIVKEGEAARLKEHEERVKNTAEALKDAEKNAFSFSQALQDVNNTMQLLGISSDSTLGKLIGGMTAAAAAGDALKKGLADGASSQQKFAAAAQGIGTAVDVFKKQSILGGIGKGAAMGAAFGPWGAAIGAVAGGVVGLAGKLFGGDKAIMQLNDMRDAFFETQGGWEELQKKLNAIGQGDSDLIKRIFDADTVDEFNAAVRETQGLLDLQGQSQQALNEAVDRYGFSIEQLGPKFRQQELDQQAGQLLQDFKLLTASGIETGLVIEKMGPALSEFVNTSIAAGTTIPAAMKPMIDQFIQSGQLLDANGNAFTSAEQAGITFAETMTESVSRMIASIDQLVSALTGVPNVQRTITVNTVQTGGGVPVPGDTGGNPNIPPDRQFARGISYVPQDMVAGLHRGERVVPADENKQNAANGAGSRGGSFSYTAPQVVIQGSNLSKVELAETMNQVMRDNERGAVTRMRKALAARG